MKKILIIVFILSIFLIPAANASSISYPPSVRDLNLEVGEVKTVDIHVKNTESRPVNVIVENIGSKVSVDSENIRIRPGKKQEISLRIEGLKAGEIDARLHVKVVGGARTVSYAIKLGGTVEEKPTPEPPEPEPNILIYLIMLVGGGASALYGLWRWRKNG